MVIPASQLPENLELQMSSGWTAASTVVAAATGKKPAEMIENLHAGTGFVETTSEPMERGTAERAEPISAGQEQPFAADQPNQTYVDIVNSYSNGFAALLQNWQSAEQKVEKKIIAHLDQLLAVMASGG